MAIAEGRQDLLPSQRCAAGYYCLATIENGKDAGTCRKICVPGGANQCPAGQSCRVLPPNLSNNFAYGVCE